LESLLDVFPSSLPFTSQATLIFDHQQLLVDVSASLDHLFEHRVCLESWQTRLERFISLRDLRLAVILHVRWDFNTTCEA
jgi:hypothetical protein